MKKGKSPVIITIGIVCMILTAVIFIQFKTINQTDITSLEAMREEDLRAEITSVKTKYDEIAKEIEETKQTIKEYEEIVNSDKKASETLNKELQKSRDLLRKKQCKR
jgi:uncharacterized protein YlxW (UPF0749 family)